jgi:hypothetical protein
MKDAITVPFMLLKYSKVKKSEGNGHTSNSSTGEENTVLHQQVQPLFVKCLCTSQVYKSNFF